MSIFSNGIQRFIISMVLTIGIFSSTLSAGVLQTELKNDVWQLVGFMGTQGTASSVSYAQDTTVEIFDNANAKTSYFTSDGKGLTANTANSAVGATIGIFAIANKRSITGKTTLGDSSDLNVKMKIGDAPTYRKNLPMYRMYVSGKDGVSIRVDYQADYEGRMFRVKFGIEREDYTTSFSYRNTYNNPAKLTLGQEDKAVGPFFSAIIDALDFNITDNNLTKMIDDNSFTIKNSSGAYIDLTPYTDNVLNRVTVYKFSDLGSWTLFDTKNSAEGNDFDRLYTGSGYWIKVLNKASEDNITKTGIISTDKPSIDVGKTYANLKDGWNLLSFEQKDIRYAPSGMFIPYGAMDNNGTNESTAVKLYFGSHGSNESKPGRMLLLSNAYNSTSQVARAINMFSQLRKDILGVQSNIKALPAINNNSIPGVVVISDSLFEVSSINASITTLSGKELREVDNRLGFGRRGSVYGEYSSIITLNQLSGTNINASLGITVLGYNSLPQKATDLNNSNRETLTNIVSAFQKAGESNDKKSRTATNAFLIAVDFNDTLDYTQMSSMTSVLLSSGSRYSVSDSTFTKVYKHLRHGNFVIQYSKGEMSIAGQVRSTAVTDTINVINAKTETTGIRAVNLGNSYFMITSTENGIDLLENDDEELFEDTPLKSGNIPEVNRSKVKGSITTVHNVNDLLDATIVVDRNKIDGYADFNNLYVGQKFDINSTSNNKAAGLLSSNLKALSDDLKTNPSWVLDFPLSGGLIESMYQAKKKITTIMTHSYSDNDKPYWEITDLTKNPSTLYGNAYDKNKNYDNDYQSIFHIQPNKGYWVNLKPADVNNKTLDDVILPESKITTKVYTHFSDTFNSGFAITQNHINNKLQIKFDPSFINPLNTHYYNVIAIIEGQRYYLKSNGAFFQLSINDNEMGLVEKTGNEKRTIPIFLEVYDGTGKVLLEKDITKNKFNISFYKPSTPSFSWDLKKGKLILDNKGSNSNNDSIETYTAAISDVASERAKVIQKPEDKNLWIEDSNTSMWGGLGSLQGVSKTKEGFYSNTVAFINAPLYYGHTLEATPAKPLGATPYSYIQKQTMTKVDPVIINNPIKNKKAYPTFNKTNGANSGVSIRLSKTGAKVSTIRMVYYPESGAKGEGLRPLSLSLSGNKLMYIRVNTGGTGKKAIARIEYTTSYINQIFYIYFDKRLYQGRFSSSDNFDNDRTPYNLEGAVTVGVNNINIPGSQADMDITGTISAEGVIINSGTKTIQPIIMKYSSGGGGGKAPTPALPIVKKSDDKKVTPALP